MINKIKSLIQENRERQKLIFKQTQEITWGQVYSDSIRGISYLEDLSINIGRWAGNYSFFYVLNRVLMDYKPASILEFGLGESSKFISAYLDNLLLNSRHLIIEHDENWASSFRQRFNLSERSHVKLFPLQQTVVNGYESFCYKNFNESIKDKFDLYVIDGPFGSERFSRFDIVSKAKTFEPDDEFIILMDDFDRIGEKDTIEKILEELRSKNITFYSKCYEGSKAQMLIATKKYRFAASL